MAANAVPHHRTTRFSLLLLQHAEVLLSDLAAQYHFVPDDPIGSPLHPMSAFPHRLATRSAHAPIRGRIKIATHSIFFDSDDWRDPVIRVPLVAVENARPTHDNSRSHDVDVAPPGAHEVIADRSFSSSKLTSRYVRGDTCGDSSVDNSVVVIANAAIFQRELANDHPYIDVRVRGRHVFTPLYTDTATLLDEINTLLHITATTVTLRARDLRLRELVQQREARVPFDITLLQHGIRETARMDAAASAVYTMATQPGRFRITQHNLYFMPVHGESTQAVERIPINSIVSIRSLKHGCRDAALEIAFDAREETAMSGAVAIPGQQSTLMLAFPSFQVRQRAIQLLHAVVRHPVRTYDKRELDTAVGNWRAGTISTFDYILHLNFTAGRSFNDLSQYPVFPWVLQDYTSQSLDLSNAKTFRDLSLPIGALDESRLNNFLERYDDMPSPRFLYGTHYSTPAYVIHYLVRAAPAAMLRLQNGRFDTPDRLFYSVERAWNSVLSNRGDVKELIPEFYATDLVFGTTSGVVSSSSTAGEFLDNVLGLDLGTRQDGIRIDDVELPPWANGSSELFVRKLREALECDFVSQRIHLWIDLLFGVKSRNVDAFNLFYTDVALPESIGADEEKSLSEEEMDQIETIYTEFGRTPERLFQQPHQPRFADFDVLEHDDGQNVNHLSSALDSSVRGEGRCITDGGILSDSGESSSPGEKTDVERSGKESILKLSPCEIPERKTICARESSLASPGIVRNFVAHASSMDPALLPGYCMDCVLNGGRLSQDSESDRMVDIGIVEKEDGQVWEWREGDEAVFCTAWSSGHLRIHCGHRVVRSKLVGFISCIAYMSVGMVGYGCQDGSLGVYDIERARTVELVEGAHECDVVAMAFEKQTGVLVSGSKDGSVKVWRYDSGGKVDGVRVGKMRSVQEVDGESCVLDVCVACKGRGSSYGALDSSAVMVAAWTTERCALVWEVQLKGKMQLTFTEAVWRWDGGNGGGEELLENGQRRQRVVAWVEQKRRKWPHLVLGDDVEKCVRVWRIDGDKSAPDVFIVDDGGVRSVSTCESKQSILVCGKAGRITELDRTGLCIGRMKVYDEDLVLVAARDDGRELLIWNDKDSIFVTNARAEMLGHSPNS